jgi:hypothetical protein
LKYKAFKPDTSDLGLELTKAVIPDEALQQLSLVDIASYRRKSRDAYEAWTTDLNSMAADVDNLEQPYLEEKLKKIVASERRPKMLEYRQAMVDARDDLFGDLIKRVIAWEVPTLAVAHLANQNMTQIIIEFAIAALGTAAPPVIDYVKANRRMNRNSPSSFLVGLSSLRS